MEVKTAGIVGYGAFGALAHTLLQRFAPSVEVRIFAPEKDAGGAFTTLERTAQCDAVILAVPIHAFEEVLQTILPHIRPETVLLDVATVKVHTVKLLKQYAAGKRWLATHPVWGPESYEKKNGDVSGFRVVMCDGTIERGEYAALTTLLKGLGFDVVEMSADEHDKHLAETLFLTHLVGQTVVRGGFTRTDIDTVSFGYLMDAVESVRHDEKLFQDVYRYNPYCKDVLARFQKAESDVRELLERSE